MNIIKWEGLILGESLLLKMFVQGLKMSTMRILWPNSIRCNKKEKLVTTRIIEKLRASIFTKNRHLSEESSHQGL